MEQTNLWFILKGHTCVKKKMCDVQNKFTENLLNKIIKKISIHNPTHTHVVQKYPEIQNHS